MDELLDAVAPYLVFIAFALVGLGLLLGRLGGRSARISLGTGIGIFLLLTVVLVANLVFRDLAGLVHVLGAVTPRGFDPWPLLIVAGGGVTLMLLALHIAGARWKWRYAPGTVPVFAALLATVAVASILVWPPRLVAFVVNPPGQETVAVMDPADSILAAVNAADVIPLAWRRPPPHMLVFSRDDGSRFKVHLRGDAAILINAGKLPVTVTWNQRVGVGKRSQVYPRTTDVPAEGSAAIDPDAEAIRLGGKNDADNN